MHDDILKRLDQRVDRRGFLRGSGLAAAALAGIAAFPLMSAAQDLAQQPPAQDARKDDQTKDAKDKDAKTGNDDAKEAKKEDKKEDKKDAKDAANEADPFKETKKDEAGRDYRMCPQCGYNMYKQDRTWTCENCGFSYSE